MRKTYQLGAKSVIDYLCITSLANNNVITLKSLKHDGNELHDTYVDFAFDIKYSTNMKDWYTYQTDDTVTLNNNDKLYLRGTNNALLIQITEDNTTKQIILEMNSTGNCDISGRVSTLFNKSNISVSNKQLSFNFGNADYSIFKGLKLINAQNLIINIDYICAPGLFRYQTNLVTPPQLPAKHFISGSGNYIGHDYCYNMMFEGCERLISAPELPATTLIGSCYSEMFDGCSSLTRAPALPATTLAIGCYSSMFNDCSNLIAIPQLPATQLTASCYLQMFEGCSKVKLSTTQTGEYQNEYRIPILGTGTAETKSLYDMFKDTGGTYTGDIVIGPQQQVYHCPNINTTYYTSNEVI